MKNISFLSCLFIILFICETLAQRRTRDLSGVKVSKDIVYETIGSRKLLLDLYMAENVSRPQPLIIFIHGGGWKGGSKNSGAFLQSIKEITDSGFALTSINYRLSGEAIFPAAVTDCKAAVRFLRANAKKYNLNPKKFGAWGSSAGGHLVAFLGTSGDVKEYDIGSHLNYSSRVQAVCDWFGPTDFLKMNDSPISKMDHKSARSPESQFLGKQITTAPELVKKANPITYITKDDPEFSIVHGSKDLLVIFNQSELLHDALKKHKVKSELHKIEGAGHGFKGPERVEAIKITLDFFKRTLE